MSRFREVFGVAPVNTVEGESLIKSEMAAFDSLPPEVRRSIAEAAGNWDVHYEARQARNLGELGANADLQTRDMSWQIKNSRELETGQYHSTPAQIKAAEERARMAIAEARKGKRPGRHRRRLPGRGAKGWLD